jgi:signal peptidase II
MVAEGAPLNVIDAAVPAPAPDRSHVGILWWLSLGIILGDQSIKALVRNSVGLFESRPLIPGLVDLAHVRNEGVAFGLFNRVELPFKWVFTTTLALAALGGITYYARHIRPSERLARIGLSMILGGAIGNLIDRVWAGYVLDFVDVYWHEWHFWAFNVADACISIGAVLVFVDLLVPQKTAEPSVKPHASDSV